MLQSSTTFYGQPRTISKIDLFCLSVAPMSVGIEGIFNTAQIQLPLRIDRQPILHMLLMMMLLNTTW